MFGVEEIFMSIILSDPNWSLVGNTDLNGDGNSDLIWYNFTLAKAAVRLMYMGGPVSNTFPSLDDYLKGVALGIISADQGNALFGQGDLSKYNSDWLKLSNFINQPTVPDSWDIVGDVPIVAVPPAARIFYIDFVNGKDTNNGATKDAPWKHAPGMTGQTGNPLAIDKKCGGLCNYSGYAFIFKGGVTWDYTAFPWIIREHGSGGTGNQVYFGVDLAWFAGDSWSRPILNLGGQSGGFLCQTAVVDAPTPYLVFDNFEFTGLYWNHTCNLGEPRYLALNSAGHTEWKNLYFHDWSFEFVSANGVIPNVACLYPGGTNCDLAYLVQGDTQGIDTTSTFHDNVFDGSDTDYSHGHSAIAMLGGTPYIYNNIFKHVTSGAVVASIIAFHDNTCDTVGRSMSTQHDQCFEDNGDVFDEYIYNNYATNITSAQVYWIAGCSNSPNIPHPCLRSSSVYFYNNVIANSDQSGALVIFATTDHTVGGGTAFVFNNTLYGKTTAGIACGQNGDFIGGCTFRNNHLIGSNAANTQIVCDKQVTPKCVQDHNVAQTSSVANSDGFSGTSTFPWSPGTGSQATIRTGTNLSSFCSGNLSALCLGTSAGVGYDESQHTVIAPNRPPVMRPALGPWDSGAYQLQEP